jgi:hypothetical protein
MTRVVVRLGRIYDREGPGEIPKGLLRYGRPSSGTGMNGMKLWPVGTIPLLVDHDQGKRIGLVLALDTFAETDGDWLVARADLYSDAPDWIRRGTPASFKSELLHESSVVDGYVYGAYVQEVSLLQHAKPAEPGAKVLLTYDPVELASRATPLPASTPTPTLTRGASRRSRGQAEMDELRRRVDAAGPNADVDKIITAMKFELGYLSAFELMGLSA